jgi:hypothetical protein
MDIQLEKEICNILIEVLVFGFILMCLIGFLPKVFNRNDR